MAQEIHARLVQSDPLRLAEKSARRLRERWVLLEPERAFVRALAVCAEAAARESPPADLQLWSLGKIDLAIDQLVRADRNSEEAHPEVLDDEEASFPLLTNCLMLEPKLVRSASVAFNALDALPRRAFFELMIEGRTVPDVIEAGPWDEDGLYRAIQAALATLSLEAKPAGSEGRPQRRRR